MEMTYKIKDIRKVFPIYSVRDGILLSKRGDITFGWKITYPAAFSVSEQEYDDLLNSIASAVRMLPEWCIVHKQDCYFEKEYEPSGPDSFLGQCNRGHFKGRKYLEHRGYLFLTFSNANEVKRSATASSVFGAGDKMSSNYDKITAYASIAEQFISLISNSGIVKVERLDDADFKGIDSEAGIIQRYMMLGNCTGALSDIALAGDMVGVENAKAASYIVSDLTQLPGELRSCVKNESLSYQQSEILVSNGYPIGIGLDCEHIVNQYILTVPQARFIKDMETRKHHMIISIKKIGLTLDVVSLTSCYLTGGKEIIVVVIGICTFDYEVYPYHDAVDAGMELYLLVNTVHTVFDDGLFCLDNPLLQTSDCLGIGVGYLVDLDDVPDVVGGAEHVHVGLYDRVPVVELHVYVQRELDIYEGRVYSGLARVFMDSLAGSQ